MSYPGVLLTGGASRRLGRDKSTLVFHGETLAARAARVLAAVCDPVVEAGPGVSGLVAVQEDPPGAGPLAGVLAAVELLGVTGPVLLLACDMPFVEVPLLELIANWPGDGSVVPVADGNFQYACCRMSAAALDEALVVVRAGGYSLRSVLDATCEHIPESAWRAVAPEHAFRDIDTPDDLASLGL